MAKLDKRLATNAPGDFYVDTSCIDCDTCRWMAPDVFDRESEQSRVHAQPRTEAEIERALHALISCPTSSIGTTAAHDVATAAHQFPLAIEAEVSHCGYHAEATFGAASYFIQRPRERGGNVLIDVPRFARPLVHRIEDLGGIATILLTHGDDVAGHERFAQHFGARRVMHAGDITSATRDIEVVVEGLASQRIDDEIVAFPTPGHTRGSMCFLHRDQFLFSGDHVAWSRSRRHVYAFRDACWFDWGEQIESMERLAARSFAWILPGHGSRCRFEPEAMARQMAACVAWMRAT